MIKNNYHTHTKRCHHAQGESEDYVLCAIENGFETLGFSDHSPYIFGNGYVSACRMLPEELNDYVDETEYLKIKYADKIRIYTGYETEYYPTCFDETLSLIKSRNVDYLILGQHFTNNEYDGKSVTQPVSDDELVLYVNQVKEALEMGIFTYLAHPDLPLYNGSDGFYKEQMTRLCKCAKSLDVPLEINFCGIRRGRHYPTERFFEIASAVGNEVIFGCDSHAPHEVYSDIVIAAEDRARDIARKFGLHMIDDVELRKV